MTPAGASVEHALLRDEVRKSKDPSSGTAEAQLPDRPTNGPASSRTARGPASNRTTRVGSGVAAALGVLEILARSEAPLSLGAMAGRLGVSKATVARVVDALLAAGYVARHPSGRTYRIDYGVLTLAGDVLQRLVLRRRAAPHLHRLAARTGLVCFLGVLWRGHTVVLDRAAPHLLHERVLDIGKRSRMHGSSMAKAILAHLPAPDLEAALAGYEFAALGPRTITSREAFLAELAVTRERGYATSDQELSHRARSVAAPILDYRGYPAGALAAADWEPDQMPPERLARVITETRQAALAVSHTIGYAGRLALDSPAWPAGELDFAPAPSPPDEAGTRRMPARSD